MVAVVLLQLGTVSRGPSALCLAYDWQHMLSLQLTNGYCELVVGPCGHLHGDPLMMWEVLTCMPSCTHGPYSHLIPLAMPLGSSLGQSCIPTGDSGALYCPGSSEQTLTCCSLCTSRLATVLGSAPSPTTDLHFLCPFRYVCLSAPGCHCQLL